MNPLSLVPIKDWIYGGIVVALLAGGTWFVHHERVVGAQQIETKDAALRAAAVSLNTASEHLAEIQEISIGHTYEKILSAPAVPDSPGLVCHNSAPVESSSPDYRPEAPGTSASRADGLWNPSGELRTDARLADAQINGLIDTVQVLVDELNGVTK